jgi:hypothetical protein
MMMPSMVRAERILFMRSARKAIRVVQGMLIIAETCYGLQPKTRYELRKSCYALTS